ncbi:MAG: MarR family transcriptional regulator [Cyclobacteriaceae bacterium]|nr:MarR family transcriptional regulator [Cyclobacteriaceae bacterium]
MGLEEAIRQEKFESEHQKAAINILFTSSWLYNLNALFLKPYQITPEQFNVLRILRGSHPRALRLADIACRMIDKSSNATRLVEKLRQKGMVSRTVCESNRRQVDIHITPKGQRVLEKIDKESGHWTTALQKLSRDEAHQLNRLLDKLRG